MLVEAGGRDRSPNITTEPEPQGRGPLRISNQRSPRVEVDRRLIGASEAAGIPRSRDYNGPEQDGVAMFQVNQRDGRRWSAADAFLRPALERPNLERHTRARARALDSSRARGDPERGSDPIAAMREILVSQLEPGPDKRDRSDLEADLRRRLMRPSAP